MYSFYGQPKFKINAQQPMGYELFIREWTAGQWQLPQNFNTITSTTLERLLCQVIKKMPANIEMLSFNLEQNQFIQPEFMAMVARVQQQTSIRIFTELTERLAPGVSEAEIIAAAQRFHDQGLLVCIDDVGTGQNTPNMVLKMNAYIDEYKFVFQNFRPFEHIAEITDELDFWYNLAHREHKMLALEGLETEEDLETVKRDYPCDVIQGYYTGRPEFLVQD